MNKIIIQGTITVLLFIGLWFGLSQINWTDIFKVQKATDKMEEKLGELFWEAYKKAEEENKNSVVIHSMNSIVTRICNANHIDKNAIKIHVLNKDDINAFALPNGHLIVYSGLILDAENQEELAGVISHEIAHIELHHVMKKLVREVGFSVLVSMTTGNGGTEIIKETLKLLSSSAFDRNLEKEADLTAVDYLLNSKINPEPFADFLYRLSDKEHEATKYLTWISTHPDSKERAEYIMEHSRDKTVNYTPILAEETWSTLKEDLEN